MSRFNTPTFHFIIFCVESDNILYSSGSEMTTKTKIFIGNLSGRTYYKLENITEPSKHPLQKFPRWATWIDTYRPHGYKTGRRIQILTPTKIYLNDLCLKTAGDHHRTNLFVVFEAAFMPFPSACHMSPFCLLTAPGIVATFPPSVGNVKIVYSCGDRSSRGLKFHAVAEYT